MMNMVDLSTPLRELKSRNLALLRADIDARRTVFRSLPVIVSLHTVEVCNLKCVMCERSVVPGRRKLDRAALGRVCEDLFPTSVRVLASGALGEPLLGDFDLIASAATRHGAKIDLVTNGTFLSVGCYRAWRTALGRVNVSLDTSDPEIYARIRPGGRFETVSENLRAISEERRMRPDGVVFTLSAVVMRENLHSLPELVRLAASLDLDGVQFQVLRQFNSPMPDLEPFDRSAGIDRAGGRASAVPGSGAPAEAVAIHRAILSAAEDCGISVAFGDFGLPPHTVRPLEMPGDPTSSWFGPCWNVSMNFALFPNGDVYPCCHPSDYRMGNVHDASTLEIWNSSVAQSLRRRHFEQRKTPFCSGCLEAPYLAIPSQRPTILANRFRLGIRNVRTVLAEWRRPRRIGPKSSV